MMQSLSFVSGRPDGAGNRATAARRFTYDKSARARFTRAAQVECETILGGLLRITTVVRAVWFSLQCL